MDRPIERTVELTDQEFRDVLACAYLWLKLPVARDPTSEAREERFKVLCEKLGNADGMALIYCKKVEPVKCPLCSGSGNIELNGGQVTTCDACGGEGVI